jgi:hypothetical protein
MNMVVSYPCDGENLKLSGISGRRIIRFIALRGTGPQTIRPIQLSPPWLSRVPAPGCGSATLIPTAIGRLLTIQRAFGLSYSSRAATSSGVRQNTAAIWAIVYWSLSTPTGPF